MLKSPDIFKELASIEEVRKGLKSEYEKASLKCFDLILKLLHSIRTNQTQIMRAQGIQLVKPKVGSREQDKK